MAQFADRCSFYALKDISAETMSRTVTMMTDGADQAKYMVPRHPLLQTCYRGSKLHRPRLKIHGCWAFGFSLRIAVVEENQYHGSSLVQEVLALTLEDVMRICKERQVPEPHTVVVIGDNTVKELKNRYCLTGMMNYVAHKKLRPLAYISFVFSNMLRLAWSQVRGFGHVQSGPHARHHRLLGAFDDFGF